jgi:predicted SAM-dependent methyltransferase
MIVKRLPNHTPSVAPGVNLNIGCGRKLWESFINIDFPGNWSGKKPDIEADIRAIPLPDDHADIAYAIHVLEHIQRWETEDVLKEWRRVLKPGGKLIIEVPCLDKFLWLLDF